MLLRKSNRCFRLPRFEAAQKKLQDAEKAAAEQQKKFTELEIKRRSKQLQVFLIVVLCCFMLLLCQIVVMA